eukprot:jgi/Hompol1/4667/HPOL_002483-RA
MSRHRNVRHMDLDVAYDPSAHKATAPDTRKEISQVRAVLGDLQIPDHELRSILEAHGNNVERTIDYILANHEKANAEETA